MENYIGLHYEEVKIRLKENDIPFRISKRGSNYAILTRDYRPNRINLELDINNIVTGFTRG